MPESKDKYIFYGYLIGEYCCSVRKVLIPPLLLVAGHSLYCKHYNCSIELIFPRIHPRALLWATEYRNNPEKITSCIETTLKGQNKIPFNIQVSLLPLYYRLGICEPYANHWIHFSEYNTIIFLKYKIVIAVTLYNYNLICKRKVFSFWVMWKAIFPGGPSATLFVKSKF